MRNILGISCFYHDAAAALVVDGKVVAAAQEERFTRIKHTADFPVNAIRYCLSQAELTLDDLDAIVYYEKPFLKFERLLETFFAVAPRGVFSFVKSMPVWIGEKLFIKKLLYDKLAVTGPFTKRRSKLLFSQHHLSHAAGSFFSSGFKESAILTIDGVGEWSTTCIGYGNDKKITFIREQQFPHSVGLLYSSFTYFLGFKVNSGEYKLMGLAPYGNAGSPQVKNYIALIKTEIVKIKTDGSIWLNPAYFSYLTKLKMIQTRKWEKLFGFKLRSRDNDPEQHHCDLALAIQQVTEEIILLLAKEAKRLTGSNNLCLSGGVALNCVANTKLLDEGIFENIHIQPASGDAGGAEGAALAVYHMYGDAVRNVQEEISQVFTGPSYSDKDIEMMARVNNAVYELCNDEDELIRTVADAIANGKIVGWFQGRMEFGPRALGNRSILADPRRPEMVNHVNSAIKKREGFRPFAPSVLWEHAAEYFEMQKPSPHMLFVAPVQKPLRNDHPSEFTTYTIPEKRDFNISKLPAITHVDYSARVQTVKENENGRFYKLLKAFHHITGVSVILNTSFNVRGEPIVNTPEDAFRCFMMTDLDILVTGNYIFRKKQQDLTVVHQKIYEPD